MGINKIVLQNYEIEHRAYPGGPSSAPVQAKDENGKAYSSVKKRQKEVLISFNCDNCFNTKGIITEITTQLQTKMGNNRCNICGTPVDLGGVIYPTKQIIVEE